MGINIKRTFITITTALALVAVPAGSALASSNGGGYYHRNYAALGDSVAAGLGLPPNPSGTNEDQLCGRSPEAYSSAVGSALNLRTTNAACQGAVVDNLSAPQTIGSTNIRPQLDAAFASGTPRLITLTIGANDVHWANFLNACFATTCDTEANTNATNAYLATLEDDLENALNNIQDRSHWWRSPRTVVTGYYQSMSDRCISDRITASELAWFQGRTDALNAALQETTEDFYFARFAPVDFTNHDICSADPWLQRPGVAGEPAAFHPNVNGQQAIAQAVLQTLGR